MAVPKKKTSKSRCNQRRSNEALARINVIIDKDTGEYGLPHHLDKTRGEYRNHQIVIVKTKSQETEQCLMASKIIGIGGYLSEKIVTNFDLEKSIDTSDEWIKSKTCITQRHIAATDEFISHLGCNAALQAIASAQIQKDDIDLISTCINTSDNSFFPLLIKSMAIWVLKTFYHLICRQFAPDLFMNYRLELARSYLANIRLYY